VALFFPLTSLHVLLTHPGCGATGGRASDAMQGVVDRGEADDTVLPAFRARLGVAPP